jgi:hypothetical protein
MKEEGREGRLKRVMKEKGGEMKRELGEGEKRGVPNNGQSLDRGFEKQLMAGF